MTLIPPPSLERLVAALLGDHPSTPYVIGDLREDFRSLRERRSTPFAVLWYLVQSLRVVVRVRLARRPRMATLRPPVGAHWEGFADKLTFNVRYAIRRLCQNPVFTLLAILSLALGIGANTAMFSLVNAIVLRDLPFEDPETLVHVYEADSDYDAGPLSYPDFEDLAEGSTDVFAGVSGTILALLRADVGDGVEMLMGEAVTGNYFVLERRDQGHERSLKHGFLPRLWSWPGGKHTLNTHRRASGGLAPGAGLVVGFPGPPVGETRIFRIFRPCAFRP